MAQTDVNRLLILPAIVLAAALSLTGCAGLPFFGGDSDSSNNSSSRDDDEDEDEEEEEEEEEASGSSQCPQQFLDSSSQQYDESLDEVTVAEIDPSDFEPTVVAAELDGGCFFTITTLNDGVETVLYNAFVPGGEDLFATLDEALLGGGYESMGEGFYTGTDNEYVIVYNNEDSMLTPDQIEEAGLGFLGDEFLVVTAYKGEV